jgi:SMC interacting uncharacterized protein involved in chromosome segregation
MAYNYLYDSGKVHTVTDLANKMQRSRTSVSKALNGVPEYLNEKFIISFVHVFDGIFSLEWLLNGKGQMLLEEDKQKSATPNEMTDNILEMYARMIRGVDDLRIQLKEELAEVASVRQELTQARDDFRKAATLLTKAVEKIDRPTPLFAAEEPEQR